jgi:hypothetical protein
MSLGAAERTVQSSGVTIRYFDDVESTRKWLSQQKV